MAPFSAYWRGAIWRLLRPTTIVDSVVSMVRLATNCLQPLKNINVAKPTVAHGSQLNVVTVDLSDISEITEQTEEGTTTRYSVKGLPSGAVTIGKSPDGAAALRYVDFYEQGDRYIFSNDPTIFGVVSTRGGAHCTFCVCVGKPTQVSYQDMSGEFCGALDDNTTDRLYAEFGALKAANGLSGVPLALACGLVPAKSAGAFSKVWSEGCDLFASDGQELLVAKGRAGESAKQRIEAGDTLVSPIADFIVFPSSNGKEVDWLPMTGDVRTDIPYHLFQDYPMLRHATTMDDVRSIMQAYGHYTYDTSNSPDDKGTQILLRKYNTTAPQLHLTQRIDVEVDRSCGGSALAIVCSMTPYGGVDVKENETAESYILRAARAGAVAVIKHMNIVGPQEALEALAVTDCAMYPTRRIAAGMYITSILVLSTGNNGVLDAILCKKDIAPITVKSGESIAVRIVFNKEK